MRFQQLGQVFVDDVAAGGAKDIADKEDVHTEDRVQGEGRRAQGPCASVRHRALMVWFYLLRPQPRVDLLCPEPCNPPT